MRSGEERPDQIAVTEWILRMDFIDADVIRWRQISRRGRSMKVRAFVLFAQPRLVRCLGLRKPAEVNT
jgi:hypothetical protein